MLNKIRDRLRENGTDLDDEIKDLIDGAKADLILSGVSKIIVAKKDKYIIAREGDTWESISLQYEIDINKLLEFNNILELTDIVVEEKIKIESVDPLIKRAITSYCKANFGYEDPKLAERFEQSYKSLRDHLTLSQEYTEVVE